MMARSGPLAFTPTALLLVGLAACSPALNWRKIVPAQADGFELEMPCKPELSQRRVVVPGLGEPAVDMSLLSCQADGVQWSVSHFQAGTVERQASALRVLREGLWRNVSDARNGSGQRRDLGDALPSGATAHAAARHEWMSGWRPALGALGQAPQPVQAHTWVFSRGLHVYQITAMAESFPADDARAGAFAEGFKFQP